MKLCAVQLVGKQLQSSNALSAHLLGLTKMARVVVSLKIMPDSPDSDLKQIESNAAAEITAFGGDYAKADVQPVAFGLKSLTLLFIMDENKGSTEALEKRISAIPGISSVEVVDVRRTVG